MLGPIRTAGGWAVAVVMLGCAGSAGTATDPGAPAPETAPPPGMDRARSDPGPAPSPEPEPRSSEAPALDGREWIVTELDGEPPLARSSMTLEFGEGEVWGSASCNRYVAVWSRPAPSRISVGPARSTLRACAPSIMDQERRFLELLEAWESVRVTQEGELVLETSGGVTLRARPR